MADVEKGKLTSFEEQTENNRLFSHLCENFNPFALLLVIFCRYSYMIPAMYSGKIDMSPSFFCYGELTRKGCHYIDISKC